MNTHWRKIFYGLWRVILALMILFGILFFPALGFGTLKEVDLTMAYMLVIAGPWSIATWLLLLAMFFWYPAILTAWVVRDAMKFKHRGIKTSPLLWAIGMILPTIIIVFPIYLIRRKITWVSVDNAFDNTNGRGSINI